MAQYQVPQFIDRETRLLGPLTVRQTVVLGIIAAILFALYFVVNPFMLTAIAVVLISIGVIVAFLKINGRPLSSFLFSYLGYFVNPKKFIWEKTKSKMPFEEIIEKGSQEKKPKEEPKEINLDRIKNLADILNKETDVT